MKNLKAYLVYFGVSLAVLLPLFIPGYVLTLDLVFTPTIPMPAEVTSSYLLHTVLHVLNLVIPSQVLEKLLLLIILLGASIGLHRLVRFLRPLAKNDQWGIYVAGIFYAINPFTYARFMAGQYNVLLGYALLPWFVRVLLQFGRKPGLKQGAKVGGMLALIGIVSLHTIGLAVVLMVVLLGVAGVRKQLTAKHVSFGLLAVGLFVVASSYWLIPLLAGQGSTASAISQFGASDTQTFATGGGNILFQLGNMVRLQGFWAEAQNLFLLPQDRMVLWGTWALVMLALVSTGGWYLVRQKRTPALVLIVSALVALVIGLGALGPLAQHLPLLAGYREPHKFVGLVALCYAVLLAFGVDVVLAHLKKMRPASYAPAAVGFLLVPFLLTRVMFWGFDGQLSPRQYPTEWGTANTLLAADADTFHVLFMPWHQYMTFQFTGRIIASPAPQFFSKPTLASTNPELGGAAGLGQDATHKALDHITAHAKDSKGLAPELAKQDIKYILLSKDLDYGAYAYLDTQPGLQKIHDYPTMTVYLNTDWRKL